MALYDTGLCFSEDFLDIQNKIQIDQINSLVISNRVPMLIEAEENRHNHSINKLAKRILKSHEIKIITVAGPSSSGKTTFTHRLARSLESLGIQPIVVSLDNFFVERHLTPINHNGEKDYEVIEAVDVEMYQQCMLELLEAKTVQLPKYNFVTGLREQGMVIEPSDNTIYMVEGLHGMNPKITEFVEATKIVSIYVSPSSIYYVDGDLEIGPCDVRLLRRIVRDQRSRGANPEKTFERWPMVRDGEEKYIYPFAQNADFHFNSGLHYELGILKPFAHILLNQVERDSVYYNQAKDLLKVLKPIQPIISSVPDDSILREFIGGCSLAQE